MGIVYSHTRTIHTKGRLALFDMIKAVNEGGDCFLDERSPTEELCKATAACFAFIWRKADLYTADKEELV